MYTTHPPFVIGLALISILVLSMLGVQPVQPVYAATSWYVATTGSDANSCSEPGFPCLTINGAINKATNSDSVYVAEGTYTGSDTTVVTVNKEMVLSGGWNSNFTAQSGYSRVDGENSRQGVMVLKSAVVTLDRFIIKNGRTYEGGGIHNNGILSLTNVTLTDNSAADYGGAIYNEGSLTLVNVTISKNKSSYMSGGIYQVYTTSTLNMINTTIADNVAASDAGGIAFWGVVTLENTIIARNTADVGPDCYGTAVSNGNNIIGTTSDCDITFQNSDQFNVDAGLGTFLPLQGYHPLLPTSPAINAGNSTSCPNMDQRGMGRVGVCDIGSYEYAVAGSAFSLSIVSRDDQHLAPRVKSQFPLRVVALDGQGSPVSGVIVVFTAPSNGASFLFSDNLSSTISVATDDGGVATSTAMEANSQLGSYVVQASAQGLDATSFNVENMAWYVAPNGDDLSTCNNPSTPCATINAAIDQAIYGDTILVQEGTYRGIDWGISAQVVKINKDLSLEGGWDNGFVHQSGMSIIDGQNARRGITNSGPAQAQLDHFTITNGYGYDYAGGIFNYGFLTVNNSTIKNSTAYTGGGFRNSGTLLLNNVALYGNTAHQGGAIDSDLGTITLRNVTIHNNQAGFEGGGIYAVYGRVLLNNVTVSGNTSDYEGGGINQSYDGVVEIRNSIIAENNSINTESDDCSGSLISDGHNLIGTLGGCYIVPQNGDQFGKDPQFGTFNIEEGFHPLLPNSPAVDAGDDTSCELTDQRGVSRPQGLHCDMGVYEFDSALINVTIGISSKGSYVVAPHENQREVYEATNGGPVKVQSSNKI